MKVRMSVYLLIAVIVIPAFFTWIIYMPGHSYSGPLPALDVEAMDTTRRLEFHVNKLCQDPKGRNYLEKKGLESAKNYIAEQFESYGYGVGFQDYQIAGDTFTNIEAQLSGSINPDKILVVGAHYDSVIGAPGANDNATGIAAVLELARRFRDKELPKSVRFVAFTNEEPPHFMTGNMGSNVYAKNVAAKKENVIAMFSLETVGYFSDEPGSQHYPPMFNLFYPDKGNFIAFVGNLGSRNLVTNSIRLFREHAKFPSEGIAAPSFIPGISWSDHWSFWRQGYPAVMITDTAPYRYPHYHTAGDTPDKVDYEKMVHVVNGLEKIFTELLSQ